MKRERSCIMKIRPLYDRILAKRLAEEGKTSGGLYIPDTAKEKPLEAIVVAVGSGKVLDSGLLNRKQTGSVRDVNGNVVGSFTFEVRS